MAPKQLSSVSEESSTDFTALSPRSYSYRESFLSVDGPGWCIRSTLSSQSGGQTGSIHSSISAAGASSSYGFNISGSASAGAADLGGDELNQGRASASTSINKVSSSLANQLGSVPEESTTGSTATCPPRHSYRESIRSVARPEWRIRSALSSQSGQSGSNYSSISGASSSYQSNISGCSSGSASASAVDLGTDELTKIARTMISDGYTQRIVRAFKNGHRDEQDHALKTWFIELDISWVHQLDTSASSSLEELVERWTRALTIIVVSVKELVAAVHETLAVGRFGKASLAPLLNFVAVFYDYKVEKLQTIVHMYICVCSASYDMCTKHLFIQKVISAEAQIIFNQIGAWLEEEEDRLFQKLSSWIGLLRRKLIKKEQDDLWAIEIMRGGAEVHSNTRLMVDCIVLMMKAVVLMRNSAQMINCNSDLPVLIDDTIDYLEDLLLQKSKLCLDPSLGHLFMLNNICFATQVFEPLMPSYLSVLYGVPGQRGLPLESERQKYMDSYLEVSWGHVMSCLSSSNFVGPLGRWIKTSPLAKFQSEFHKTYQTQKFWKVPDPLLRSLLRETITKIVIPGYQDYLEENPDLEKQVSGGSNSPDSWEKMLGELFEG